MEIKGKSVFKGIAIGKIEIYNKGNKTVVRRSIEDSAAEVERFEQAKQEAGTQLAALYEKAL